MSEVLTDWRWWLTKTDEQVRAHGLLPRDRVLCCGHRRSLPTWVSKTVGLWATAPHAEIRKSAEIAVERRGLYDMTTSRWGLRDRQSAKRHHWYAEKIALFSWALVATGDAELPPGQRVWSLHGRLSRHHSGPGILPVEAYLYYATFADRLVQADEDPHAWAMMSMKERLERWQDLGMTPIDLRKL